ncbi:hypothetical protein Bca4012_047558 [Brassica carinata]|uniref:LysM domain-containing protein n=2 Tax=Brassica TaxID=3705 RepID=A0A0D3AI63_BRAOL|nr:PREDICTED: uncharacterized protein LOC106327857 [Brassica oleracea var. oleracea]KAG2279462.1 hypothetical protein Bca52824_050682 [Brassica carinata]
MFMDCRERRLSNRNGTSPEYTNGKFRDDKNSYGGGFFLDPSSSNILRIPSQTSSSSPPRSSSSSPYHGSSSPDRGFIEHRVSKFDTLAGIAIKYGVEVGDVKKMNGLVTDLQMFALKSLRIPLPGRHPPSPCLSNGSLHRGEGCSCHELGSQNDTNSDAFDSFQSLRLKSSEKKGYYGLKPPIRTVSVGGSLEMGAYKTESNGDSQYLRPFTSTNTPLNHHRKSRSLVDALLEEFNQSSQEPSSNKFMRRRQKSEADFTSRTPELMLKEENSSSSNGGFLSSVGGKGLALRSKASSRTSLSSAESETCSFNPVPMNLIDTPVSDSFASVRKSSSAWSLQDPDGNSNNGSSSLSLWPTSKWSLKPDLLTTPAVITSSIFDGLPKPLTGRRNKTAMD